MKKSLLYILILVTRVGSFMGASTARAGTTKYFLLAPFPCKPNTEGCELVDGKYVLRSFDAATSKDGKNTALGRYLNIMITIFIGLCAVLSVAMIVIGGLEYMTSELSHSKQAGKERIEHAILGLLIALGAYALLYTINPQLLNTDLNVESTPPASTSANPALPSPNPAANIPIDSGNTNKQPGNVIGG